MANQNKNFLFRRIQKSIRNYERAKIESAQASWILQNADKEVVMSGSRPGLINKYKIDGITGQLRRIAKNVPV